MTDENEKPHTSTVKITKLENLVHDDVNELRMRMGLPPKQPLQVTILIDHGKSVELSNIVEREQEDRLKELEAKKRAQQFAAQEAYDKRQAEIARRREEMELRGKGWDHWPSPPNEKFYHEGVCDICSEEVMFLKENSPNRYEKDFPLDTPLDKNSKDSHGIYDNFETRHVCNQVTPAVISKIMSMINDLRLEIIKTAQMAKEYSMMGRMEVSR